ncbi:MAG: hypothetical protein RMJ35_12265 [Phycisphaerales bacterium]|nr:hypothetical protein [Phycisphaerales bacterium]
MHRSVCMFLVLVGGCCCAQQTAAPTTRPATIVLHDRPAAALAFAPPAGVSVPEWVLERTQRGPSAFVGYESLSTEHFWLRIDDRYRFGRGDYDRFERRAVSTRVGVLER